MQRIGDLMAKPKGANEAYAEILNEPEIVAAMNQYKAEMILP